MKTKILRTIVVFFLAATSVNLSYSNYYNDSTRLVDVDPLIVHLDSMSYSLFTRDKFFVSDDELLASINMPMDLIPRYTDREIMDRMALIPSLIPLQYNGQVKQFIDLFAYKRRGLMARCLANSQIYFPVFEEILDRKGLPIELKYLPIVESAFNPIAVSRAGATGLWQLMYGTGAELGLHINSYIDERRDPVKATEAAVNYLQKLYNMYGDWHLVLAAYNSGPGNVNKAIARAGGVKNFWAIMNYLPAETRSYVPTYIAVVYVMNQYKDYGLVSAEPRRELYTVDTVLITAKVSLKHISSILTIPEDELQFLNPSIKIGVIPQTEKGFPLNLPISYFALFEAKKAEIMNDSSNYLMSFAPVASGAPKTTWHTVRSNESLGKIAAKYGVSVSTIRSLNNLRSNTIHPGQKLKITSKPAMPAVSPTYLQAFASKIIEKPVVDSTATQLSDSATTTEAEVTADPKQETPAVADKGIKLNEECGCVYHVVQPGDTLWNIAQKYEGVTFEKLKAANQTYLQKPMKVGDVVKVLF